MKLGMIGLGKMGLGLSLNLLRHRFDVVAYDVDAASVNKIATEGAPARWSPRFATSLADTQ